MCGRFLLFSEASSLASHFDLTGFPELAPRYNIAPTQPVAVVRADAGSRDDDGEDGEGEGGGLMASLFAMMYTPYGFRVVCECS